MHQRVPSSPIGAQQSASSYAPEVRAPHFPPIRPSEIAATNLWCRKRSALRFETESLALSITPASRDLFSGNEARRFIRLGVGDRAASMCVPLSLIVKALQSYGLPPGHMPRDHIVLLLLEHRFAGAIEALERRLNLPIVFRDLSFKNNLDGEQLAMLDAKCELWGEEYGIELSLPTDLALSLGRLLDASVGRRKNGLDVPIAVASRIAVTELALGAFMSIRLGDVILADATAGANKAFIVVGERLMATGRWQDSAVTLLERPRKIPSGYGGVWSMSDMGNFRGEAEAVDAELDDIQIRVVFELGRKELSLGELRSLAPGYVFDLGRDQRAAVDIYAGTQRVGLGEIIQINDTLGVRVTRLFNNE